MKKIIEFIKRKKIMIIISLICAIVIIILVIKGMNKFALLITALFFAGTNCKDLIRNKKIDERNKNNIDEIRKERNDRKKKIDNLSDDDLLNDFNDTYSKRRRSGSN